MLRQRRYKDIQASIRAFLFYCCIINYHSLSCLEQHVFIISQFPWVRISDTAQLGPLFKVSQNSKQGVHWSCGLHLQLWVLFQGHWLLWNTVSCSYRTHSSLLLQNHQEKVSELREGLNPFENEVHLIRSGPPWIISLLMNSMSN